MSDRPLLRSAAELRQLLQPHSPAACTCALRRCGPWDRVGDGDWPREHLAPVATLRDGEVQEPTFEEYHPEGTRYESPDAPVAVRFFPFNRCDVWLCARCDQHWLRYTEFGGYYVDQRARRLQAGQIVD